MRTFSRSLLLVVVASACADAGSVVAVPEADLGTGVDLDFGEAADTLAEAAPDPGLEADAPPVEDAAGEEDVAQEGPDHGPTDPAAEEPGPEATTDPEPQDVAPDPDPGAFDVAGEESRYCEDISPTPIPIGQPCSSDCECETGMCYREAYTAGVGICTKECIGEAGGEGCPDANEKFKCLIFGTNLKDTYALTISSICMPICYSLEDCKAVSDVYGYCPGNGKKMTTWDEVIIGGQATCQIEPM